jgi:hypothetical protein
MIKGFKTNPNTYTITLVYDNGKLSNSTFSRRSKYLATIDFLIAKGYNQLES